jgi:hypothetical protein
MSDSAALTRDGSAIAEERKPQEKRNLRKSPVHSSMKHFDRSGSNSVYKRKTHSSMTRRRRPVKRSKMLRAVESQFRQRIRQCVLRRLGRAYILEGGLRSDNSRLDGARYLGEHIPTVIRGRSSRRQEQFERERLEAREDVRNMRTSLPTLMLC